MNSHKLEALLYSNPQKDTLSLTHIVHKHYK